MWFFWLLVIIGVIYYFSTDARGGKREHHYSSSTTRAKRGPRRSGIDSSGIQLSGEQQRLFEILERSKDHIFVTGKAGTGKSVLLQYFKENSDKRLVVVAPTGVAALNVGGQTIHSLFRIPPEFIAKDSLKVNYRTATLLRNIDTVVIDEVSMVRADLMDAIDSLLRQARKNDYPFGGVQMVLFGDLYQLPPVVADPELHKYFEDNYSGFYFFNADVWKNAPLQIFELTNIFRQEDEGFKAMLNAIRLGKINSDLLAHLNKRSDIEIPQEEIVTLVPTNRLVNEINEYRLQQLEERLYEYRASISGKLEYSAYPTEEILRLKKGAQVILLKNDREKRWVNGSLGIVHSLTDSEIKVDIEGIVYTIPKETWNKIRYYYNQEEGKIEEEVVSSFTQYPLRLAWAMTIHRAQGQSLESVVVDMGDGAFSHGQTYVALSRCQSLDGLFLKRDISIEDIIVDPNIINFMRYAKILDIESSTARSVQEY